MLHFFYKKHQLLLLFFCISLHIQSIKPHLDSPELRYNLAFEDVKVTLPSETGKILTAINPWNNNIIWNKKGQVLVVSYMRAWATKYYMNDDLLHRIRIRSKGKEKQFAFNFKNVGIRLNKDDSIKLLNKIDTPAGSWDKAGAACPAFPAFKQIAFYPNWITAAPDVQYFLYNWKLKNPNATTKDITTRLNERLGLTYKENNETKFVIEMWVNFQDLFRPSWDPEISDTTTFLDPQSINILKEDLSNSNENTPENNKLFLEQLKPAQTSLFSPYDAAWTTEEQWDIFVKAVANTEIDNIVENEIIVLQRTDPEKTSKNPKLKQELRAKKQQEFEELLAKLKTTDRKKVYEKWYRECRRYRSGSMPWSGMGYTFDYSKEAFKNLNSGAHVGESEFVVKPGSDITIQGIYSLDYYCSDQFVKNRFLNHYKKIKNKCEKYLAQIEAFDANQIPIDEIFKADQQLRYTWKQLFYYTQKLHSSNSSPDTEIESVKEETAALEEKITQIRTTMFDKIEKREKFVEENMIKVTKETEERVKREEEKQAKREKEEKEKQFFLRKKRHQEAQTKLDRQRPQRDTMNQLHRMQSSIL